MPRRAAILPLALLLALLPAMTLRGEVRVLKNFTLIDGTARAAVAGSAMVIDNGRIQWVGPVGQLKAPAGAENVDLSGKFVMPGMINLHGHVGATVDLTQDVRNLTRENIEKNLKTYAAYGVTSVLSLGTDSDIALRIRDEQRQGRPKMSRIFSAGQGFLVEGCYGGLAGLNRGIPNLAAVDAAVAAQAAKKVDIIKLWMDDHLGSQKKMPLEMGKAIIESAHKRGFRVAAHVFYLADAKYLVEAGADALAHSVRDKPVDGSLIELMKKRGTWQMAPTLSREASMFAYGSTPPFASDPFFTRGVSANVPRTLASREYQDTIKADPRFPQYPGILEMAKKNLKALAAADVKYGFGTDTGPPGRFPGFLEHRELELMVEAGLTPQQAIVAATKSAAEFLKAPDLGTLEAGKWADLIVLDRNPLANIANSRSIASVYIAGNAIR